MIYPTIISDGELADFDIYCVTVEITQDTPPIRARGGGRVMAPSPMTLEGGGRRPSDDLDGIEAYQDDDALLAAVVTPALADDG